MRDAPGARTAAMYAERDKVSGYQGGSVGRRRALALDEPGRLGLHRAAALVRRSGGSPGISRYPILTQLPP
jgi:hypothetical protein